MKTKRLLEEYPTRNGIPIPAYELELPEFESDTYQKYEIISNHHDCWSKKKFGKQILYIALRKLEICQSVLPNTMHSLIHATFESPRLPQPIQTYTYLLKAAENDVRLKTGTALNPKYQPISHELIERIHENYKQLR